MPEAGLSQLFVYPLKSGSGTALSEARLTPRGIEGDRRWMLTDSTGKFLSQRRLPQMARLTVEPPTHHGELRVRWRGEQSQGRSVDVIVVEPPKASAERCTVTLWGQQCEALKANASASAWFSRVLGADCSLVFQSQHAHRQVDPTYAEIDDHVSFADGFPYLIVSESSLELLNDRIARRIAWPEDSVDMRRFRPNVVISGVAPFAEDRWRRIRIGKVIFKIVKPCSRCDLITVDPERAVKGMEPLRTLATFRRFGGQVYFGQNALAEVDSPDAVIRLGDSLEVLEMQEEGSEVC